ncbi:MAG: hypothetical protein WB586_18750 [Chthoniobacterales bacterium]
MLQSAPGKIFLVEARDILRRTADAVKKARAVLASQAEINAGYAPSGTVEILPRVLRTFRGSFPGVRKNWNATNRASPSGQRIRWQN